MARTLSCFAAAGLAVLLAQAASAQMNTPTPAGRSVVQPFETIVRVDRGTNQVVVENAAGQQRAITLDNATSIQRQGRSGAGMTAMRSGELAVGDRIVVTGASRRGGFTAQQIEVVGSGGTVTAPPPVAAPGTTTTNPATPTTPDVENPAMRPGAVPPGVPNPMPPGAPGGANPTPARPPGGAAPTPGSPPGGGPAPGAPR